MLRFKLNIPKLIRKMSIFTQSFDPITGCAIWEEKDPDYDYHQEVARSAFADMLHDHERNQKYFDALKLAIETKHRLGEKANVLDIGTGTGLLSMMAAKCGADTITACEAFRPMAKCALEIIKANGYDELIKLVKKRSTEMIVGDDGDMQQRANILVTEVFDTELIGEGALQTFKHAQENLLEDNSIIVPSKGTIYVQVIEGNCVSSWHRIRGIDDDDDGIRLVEAPAIINNCPGSLAVHDLQLSQLPRDSFKPLSPVLPVFKFDWSGKEPLVFDESVEIQFKGIADGRAAGVFMWWDLVMDIEEKILLSCAPVWEHPDAVIESPDNASLLEAADKIPWRDHWMQAIYYLPKGIEISKNKEFTLIGCHDEYSLWFQLNHEKMIKKPYPPACDCSVHLAYSRSRLGQLNDSERNKKYIKALKKRIKPETTCLCFSDGSLLALAAANLGAKEVIILEPNYLSRRALEAFINSNKFKGKIRIYQSIEELPKDIRANLIFGEPYYVNSIFPWDNFRFWYLSSKYSAGAEIIPRTAKIHGVAVEFKNLHKIREPLGVCEGFDLTIFDKLVEASSEISDSPVEVQPLWEYPGKALTSSFELASFDFTDKFDEDEERKFSGKIPIIESGSCNGIALWVDWHLDSETTISTGPKCRIIPGKRINWDIHTRQGVFLLRKIENVTKNNNLNFSLNYSLKKDKNVVFKFSLEKN